MGSKKTFFGPKKKKKLALFAQRKDFLRFRVGFCSKKTGNRRKKELAPFEIENRGASLTRQGQPTTALRAAAPGQEATELESALERESRKAASEHGAVPPQC